MPYDNATSLAVYDEVSNMRLPHHLAETLLKKEFLRLYFTTKSNLVVRLGLSFTFDASSLKMAETLLIYLA